MSEIVNLNKTRKAKVRSAEKARGDENAVKFGRTKAEKSRNRTEAEKAAQHLDAHRREE